MQLMTVGGKETTKMKQGSVKQLRWTVCICLVVATGFLITHFLTKAHLRAEKLDRVSSPLPVDKARAAQQAVEEYATCIIRNQFDKAYSKLSLRNKSSMTLSDYVSRMHKAAGFRQLLGLDGIQSPRLRSDNLVLVRFSYHLSVLKGRNAGTKGHIIKSAYATQENGEWKVIDPTLLLEKQLSRDEDPVRTAEEFIVDWWCLDTGTIKQCPITADSTTKIYNANGAESRLPLQDWQLAERKRLGDLGELDGIVTGELISRTGNAFSFRTGFILAESDGSSREALYDIQVQHDKDRWHLQSVKPRAVLPCADPVFKPSVARQVNWLKSSVIATLKTTLDRLQKNPDSEEARSILPASSMSSFKAGEVRSMREFLYPSKDGYVDIDVDIQYQKDSPPEAVSGPNIVRLKLNENGNWSVAEIIPVSRYHEGK